MIQFLSGAIMMGCLVCCLFLFRGWRQTRDPLLLHFGIAFALLAFERVGLAAMRQFSEANIWIYLLRLASFTLISYAVVRKNLDSGPE